MQNATEAEKLSIDENDNNIEPTKAEKPMLKVLRAFVCPLHCQSEKDHAQRAVLNPNHDFRLSMYASSWSHSKLDISVS